MAPNVAPLDLKNNVGKRFAAAMSGAVSPGHSLS